MEPPLSPRFNMRRAAVERDRTRQELHSDADFREQLVEVGLA